MLITLLVIYFGFKFGVALTKATFSGNYYRDR